MNQRTPSTKGAFSKRLSRLLDDQGIGIREAAKIAEVSPSTLMSWKSGAVPTNYGAILKLSRSLKVSFCFLLTGESDIPPHANSLYELLDEGAVKFEGYAHVKLVELIPLKHNQETRK